MSLDVGDTETLTALYSDENGQGADPATVTLTIVDPTGAVSTPALGASSPAGHYEHDLALTLPGVWRYTWASTTPAQVESGVLVVGGPRDGPAPWISADDVFSGTACRDVAEADRDHVLADRAVRIASFVLWRLSGRQYPGVLTDVVRPCRSHHTHASWDQRAAQGWWSTGVPWGFCGCGEPDHCGCGSLSQVALPGAPQVLGIIEVLVDGQALPQSAYRLDEWRRLVRLGDDAWPCCQPIDEPTTEPGTWSVEYAFGAEPPEAGKQAARDLACELYRGGVGGDCALPKRVSSLTRQGVSMAILDPFTFFDKGKTGIYSVDLFLAAVNPNGRQRRGTIASPDVGRHARTTGR